MTNQHVVTFIVLLCSFSIEIDSSQYDLGLIVKYLDQFLLPVPVEDFDFEEFVNGTEELWDIFHNKSVCPDDFPSSFLAKFAYKIDIDYMLLQKFALRARYFQDIFNKTVAAMIDANFSTQEKIEALKHLQVKQIEVSNLKPNFNTVSRFIAEMTNGDVIKPLVDLGVDEILFLIGPFIYSSNCPTTNFLTPEFYYSLLIPDTELDSFQFLNRYKNESVEMEEFVEMMKSAASDDTFGNGILAKYPENKLLARKLLAF
ncbi:MAG: hypothetical protein MHPSP_001794 [Paramarteilia canceri]